MDYFSIHQMQKIDNAVELHIKTDNFYDRQQVFKIEDADKILDSTVMYVTTGKNNFYSDLIDTPIFIISDKLKELFSAYTDELIYKCVTLTDYYEKKQEVYWLALMEEVQCISNETKFRKDGMIEKLILDKEKIRDKKIFRIANIKENIVVVDFDISESILRRNIDGIEFRLIQTE